MTFHRKALPSYFIAGGGSLLGGYDMINDPTHPSVGGSGAPVGADGKKSGGPNDGTYFMAFGEDATSTFLNRPGNALADNTDFIDNILNQSIPSITSVDATSVGAVTTVALTGEVYIGVSGAPNNQAERNKLIRVTDQNDNDLEVSGSKIIASLIHNGASVNVVGTTASGFFTNPSVNFSPSIPATTAYRVYFGIRDSYSHISITAKGALFENSLRTINNVPGEVRALLRQVHSEPSINQAWDAAFDSTIRSLASAGLNERYRRSTTQPPGFLTGDYNVAGSGRIINRDGGAVEIQVDPIDLTVDLYPDSQLAGLRIMTNVSPRALASFTSGTGGDIGYIHESDATKKDSAVEAIRNSFAGPAVLDIIPRDIRAATSGGHNVLTFINPTATGLLNPDSTGTTTGRRTVQCAAGQYFSFSGSTGIRIGTDLLEITYSGRPPETYFVSALLSSTRASVQRLTGNTTNLFPATSTACTIRWLQTSAFMGGSGGTFAISSTIYGGRRFSVLQPAPLTDDPASENWPNPPSFFAALTTNLDDDGYTAMAWGAATVTNDTIPPEQAGKLRGDGSIDAFGLRMTTGDITLTAGNIFLTNGGINLAVGGIISANDINTADDLVAGDDLFVGDKAHITGDADVGTLAIMHPSYHVIIDQDWIRASQSFAPNLIQTPDGTWLFNEVAGTMTLNNGTPSAKNPGQLQFIAAGGSTAKMLSVFPTSQFPIAFANLEVMEIVLAVVPGASSPAPKFVVGLFDSTTTALSNDNLSLGFQPSLGWFLRHIVAGSGGAHNNLVLGAQTDNVFVVASFVRQTNGDIQVLFNGVLATTVTVAQLPTGNATLVIWCEQTTLDVSATTFIIDKCYARAFTATSRAGL